MAKPTLKPNILELIEGMQLLGLAVTAFAVLIVVAGLGFAGIIPLWAAAPIGVGVFFATLSLVGPQLILTDTLAKKCFNVTGSEQQSRDIESQEGGYSTFCGLTYPELLHGLQRRFGNVREAGGENLDPESAAPATPSTALLGAGVNSAATTVDTLSPYVNYGASGSTDPQDTSEPPRVEHNPFEGLNC